MGPKKAKKTVEETYKGLTQHEHILLRPDTYIGSINMSEELMWIYDEALEKIVKKKISYLPGLYKLYDEVIVNAADRIVNDATCNKIEITIDKDSGLITVKNNGMGIPVEFHKVDQMYVPTMIFGKLLTGSNFDDNEEKITGGRNGYGAKLANIFSQKFSIETVDSDNQKKFKQEWSDNMYTASEPVITTCKSSSYTLVSFIPDFKRFKVTGLSDDMIALFCKRAYDIAGLHKGTTVYFNGNKIKMTNFKSYIDYYKFTEDIEGKGNETTIDYSNIIYFEIDRWQVALIYAPNQSFEQISYVNSICTYNGGSHVTYIIDQVTEKVKEKILKKDKDIKIKPQSIKDNLILFLNCTIVNPTFTSQVKDNLNTKIKDFGSTCVLLPKFYTALFKTDIVSYVIGAVQNKDQLKVNKKVTKNTRSLSDILKLEDAEKAGTKESHKCVLIVTEGDSAKALAVEGIKALKERQCYYGVYPLRGKPLNVREHSSTNILSNVEIAQLCRIIGLEIGNKNIDPSTLRYGRIMVMADQDYDGFHIRGLILSNFHCLWPNLLKANDFFTFFKTPIVKATKGKEVIEFFNNCDYQNWKETSDGKWHIKYYKGLGTSQNSEAKQYFKNIDNLMTSMICEESDHVLTEPTIKKKVTKKVTKKTVKDEEVEDEEEDNVDDDDDDVTTEIKPLYKNPNTEAITLAFEKGRSDDRKVWVRNDVNETLDYTKKVITIPEFIHKELIFFSRDDCKRSIPSLDGLKPSQRKILFTVFKRNYVSNKSEVKVAQLAGAVSEIAAYHHGEASLQTAIVGMAQNYPTSNNINILAPSGQFGTRENNGADYAAPRYIYTYLDTLSQLIFRKEDNDILNYLDDDGLKIEPSLYYPIIPMLLVNGTTGIGTGFSTNVPKYSPIDLVNIIKDRLLGNEPNYDIIPFYRGFTGSIVKSVNDPNKYIVYGRYSVIDEKTFVITEIPIGYGSKSPFAYKQFLEELKNEKIIISHESKSSANPPRFTVTMDEDTLHEIITDKSIYKKFKLTSSLKITNMYVYDVNNCIKRYKNVKQIIDDYYDLRYQKYVERKKFLIGKLEKELNILKWKVKFIEDYNNGTIEISNVKKIDIIKQLKDNNYPGIDDNDEDEGNDSTKYNYLLSMKLWDLTLEKVQQLLKAFKEKDQELKKVKNTTVEEQWTSELDEFLEQYNLWLEEMAKNDENEDEEEVKTKKTKRVYKKPKATA